MFYDSIPFRKQLFYGTRIKRIPHLRDADLSYCYRSQNNCKVHLTQFS